MAEKKENSKNFDINFFKQYIELIKKILFKITKIRSPNLFFYCSRDFTFSWITSCTRFLFCYFKSLFIRERISIVLQVLYRRKR